jgi:hypothetical protein
VIDQLVNVETKFSSAGQLLERQVIVAKVLATVKTSVSGATQTGSFFITAFAVISGILQQNSL